MWIKEYRIKQGNMGWNLCVSVFKDKKIHKIRVNGKSRQDCNLIAEEMFDLIEKGNNFDSLKRFERRYPDQE